MATVLNWVYLTLRIITIFVGISIIFAVLTPVVAVFGPLIFVIWKTISSLLGMSSTGK